MYAISRNKKDKKKKKSKGEKRQSHVTWIKCLVYEYATRRKTWNNS